MAVDITSGVYKGGDPNYSSANIRGVSQERSIVLGTVKANVHGSHMGVIQVFIPEMGTDEEDKSQWRSVRYCSPFYSRVESSGTQDRYIDTKQPAGIITPPPDLGTQVLCFFPQGRNAEGFYFACVPDLFMMQTLPEPTRYQGYIGAEFNDKNPNRNTDKITNFRSQFRPVDFVTQKIVTDQGLDRDTIRGLNNSSYMRESPSEIVGITSKGRRITKQGKDFLKENKSALQNINSADAQLKKDLLGPSNRRKGHSITLDDGDFEGNSNQIRLRTSTGHQILMNDTEGLIYIGNAKGTVWIELGQLGTLDVYANDSINFRSKNINFHADENIKFHSNGYTQIVSDQQLHLQSEDDLVMQAGADAGITSKKFSVKASGSMNLSGGATSSIKASGIMSVSGSLVMLQGPSLGGQTAKPVRQMQHLDPKYSDFEGGGKYVLSRDSVKKTTVDRLATHEPFVGHGTKNKATPYSGGLAGGGGLASAVSIISAGFQLAQSMPPGTFTTTGVQSNLSNISNSSTFVGKAGIDGVATATIPKFDFSNVSEVAGGFDLGSIDFGPLGETFTSISDTIGDQITTFKDTIGDTIGKFGNSITGTDITSSDFPGIDAFGGAGEDVGFIGNFSNISPSFDTIASNITTTSGIESTWSGIGDLGNLGKLVTDNTGKIVDLAKEISKDIPAIVGGIQEGVQKINTVVPGASDKLGAFLGAPISAAVTATDIVKTLDTGFSIGALEATDVQALNATVKKLVGSNNATNFVDSVTKTVGKYGFDVEQLKSAGYVRSEVVFNDQLANSASWTGKDNISTLNRFLQNDGIQEQIQQQDIGRIYQSLVNNGSITPFDSKQEVMAMITGAKISNVDVAKSVRLGNVNIEGLLRNTTNVPPGKDIASVVINAMQSGGSASTTVDNLKTKADIDEDLSQLKRFSGTLKKGQKIKNIGGISYVVPDETQDPYSGSNGGKKRELDKRIAKLEKDKFKVRVDGNDNNSIVAQIDDKLTELYSLRHSLI